MNILVTGGAGFIGSHTVVELVEAGYNPIIIDTFENSEPSVLNGIEKIVNKKIKCYQANCNDFDLLLQIFRDENIDGVIHFAAHKAVGESVENPLKYYENNMGSLITLLKAMRVANVNNIVFSSSCTVYGEPDQIPVTEETPRKPATSPYGNTKTMGEDILKETVSSKASIRAISLRYFNPIGAHSTAHIGELPLGVPSNLVPFVTQTAAGIRQKLTIFGTDYDTADGTNIRDFIHVIDVAKAHIKALEFLASQHQENFYDVFNIGTGKGNTVLEVIKTFEQVNNLTLNYEIGDRRAGDVEKIYGNVDKANNILHWQATKTLANGLKDAWRWQLKLSEIDNQ